MAPSILGTVPLVASNADVSSTVISVKTGSINSSPVQAVKTDEHSAHLASRTEVVISSKDALQATVAEQTKSTITIATNELTEILTAFSKQAETSNLSSAKALKLEAQLAAIKQIINQSQSRTGELSTKDTALVSLHFENIGNTLPSGKSTADLKELATLLGQNFASVWVQQEKQANVAQWAKEQVAVFKPGAASAKSLTVGVNAGLSALALPGGTDAVGPYVNAGINTTVGKFATADDDGAMFVDKSITVSGKVAAGAKVALSEQLGVKAGGELQYSKIKAATKFYDGPKQFAEKEGHKNSSLSRNTYSSPKLNKIASAIKSLFYVKSEMQRIDAIHQQAVNGQRRLGALLSQSGIDKKLAVFAPEHARVNIDFYSLTSRHAKAEASADFKTAGMNTSVGGSVTLTQTYGDIWIGVPKSFTKALQDNTGSIDKIPANYYQHAKNLVDGTPAKYQTGAALNTIDLLGREIERYSNAVKTYDYQKSLGRSADTKELTENKKIKHAIERQWGAVGRHQFLQFSAASHAYLTNRVAQSSMDLREKDVQRSSELISSVAAKIHKPSFGYTARRLDALVNLAQRFVIRLDDNKVSFNISAGPVSGTLDIAHKVREHPSILREGEYVDISFTLAASASLGSLGAVQKLNSQINAQIGESLAAQGITDIGDFNITPDASGSVSGTHMLRFFKPTHDKYAGKSEFRQLFSRTLGSISGGANLALSGSAAPGVTVGASVSVNKSETHVLNETLGGKDLTYPTMMYKNFFDRNGNDAKNSEWMEFEHQHQAEFTQLFQNMGNPEERVYSDAQALLDQQIGLANATKDPEKLDNAQQFKTEFTASMLAASQQPYDIDVIKSARQHFDTLLSTQVPIVGQAFVERFVHKDVNLSANSALSLGSVLVNKLTGRNQQSLAPATHTSSQIQEVFKPLQPTAPVAEIDEDIALSSNSDGIITEVNEDIEQPSDFDDIIAEFDLRLNQIKSDRRV